MTTTRPRRPLRYLATLGLLALVPPAACSSSDESSGLEGNYSCEGGACLPDGRPDPCKLDLKEFCGSECDTTNDCEGGTHCDPNSKECTATCSDESPCPTGMVCDPTGFCKDPGVVIDDDGTGGSGGMGGSGNNDCIDVDVAFDPQIPTVVLLIDQSGSMHDGGQNDDDFADAVNQMIDDGDYIPWDCDDSDWRWNVVRNVLHHPDRGIVKPLESQVRFGQVFYTSFDGSLDGKTCPVLDTVDIAFDNHSAMSAAFECNDIEDDTPTADALEVVAADLAAFDEPGPKVIILATDGEPDTCATPDPGKGADEPASVRRQLVVDAATTAATNDITTHVINVSTPTNTTLQNHLEDVAEAGGGQVYPGFDPSELSQAFSDIINGVRSCVIDLDGEIDEGKEDLGTVVLAGETLTLDDDTRGWKVNSASQIELTGTACDDLKGGAEPLTIRFPCNTFTLPGPK